MSRDHREPIFIPEEVAVDEWFVPGKVVKGAGVGKVTNVKRDMSEGGEVSGEVRETDTDALALPSSLGDLVSSTSLSFVVRSALDELLLGVIHQLQHDLHHGPAATRSKIASQFLPRIMRALDKEDEESDDELEKIRAEMEKLNQEMITGEPRLYSVTPQTPDSEDLPIVDPQTGLTVEMGGVVKDE